MTTSEEFRRNPNMRNWDTSYTKRVVAALYRVRDFVRMFKGSYKPINDAIELLDGYWQDLHVPYEQRDAALAEVKRLDEVATDFRKELSAQDKTIKKLGEELEQAKCNSDLWRQLHGERGERMLVMRSAYWKLYERLHGHPHPMSALTSNAAWRRKYGKEPYLGKLAENLMQSGFGEARTLAGYEFSTHSWIVAAPSFRCIHWPLATENIITGRTICEHGCHTVPLEWWHNGTHRAPLNRDWQNQTDAATQEQK